MKTGTKSILTSKTRKLAYVKRILRMMGKKIPSYFGMTKEQIAYRENYSKIYVSKNGAKNRATVAAWAKANPEKATAKTQRYQARRKAATPADISADELKAMSEMYELAKQLSDKTGTKYHVDHRKPLIKGGLNVLANLQVIPAILNFKKGTKNEN